MSVEHRRPPEGWEQPDETFTHEEAWTEHCPYCKTAEPDYPEGTMLPAPPNPLAEAPTVQWSPSRPDRMELIVSCDPRDAEGRRTGAGGIFRITAEHDPRSDTWLRV